MPNSFTLTFCVQPVDTSGEEWEMIIPEHNVTVKVYCVDAMKMTTVIKDHTPIGNRFVVVVEKVLLCV